MMEKMTDGRLDSIRRSQHDNAIPARVRRAQVGELVDEAMRLRAENERLITVVILAEEHISAQGTRRTDKTRGGRLLGIIDEALGRTAVRED